jgi:predicted phosphodiesterase/transposase-like protein
MVWTNDSIKVLQACITNGMSYREIAKRFGVTSSAIEHAVRRHELQGTKDTQAKNTVLPDMDRINLEGCEEENFEDIKKACKIQWNVPKTKIPSNKKKEFKSYIIVGDIHVPEQDDCAMNAVFQLMKDVKFDGIINIGDYMDFSSISRWTKGKNKTLEGMRLKNDYIKGNAILDVFDELLPKGAEKHFLTGNHDIRVDTLIDELPMLEGLFDFQTALHLKERGYKVYPHNEIVKFGRLCVVHGIYCGSNPAKTHATKLLSNVLCGHLHSPEMALIHSPAKEVSVVGMVNGCLCSMQPEYMAGKPSNWSQGISILYVFPDNQFDVHLIRLVKHKFIFNGRLYDGNSK